MTNRQLHDLSNHSSLFKTVLSACSASMDPELAVKLIMAGMTSQKQFIPAGTIEAIKQLNLSSNRFFKLCIVLVKDKGYWQHGTYIFKNLHLNTLSTHQKTELLSLAFAHLNIEIINKLMTNFDKDLSSFFVEKIKRYFTDKTPSISVKLSVIKAIISLDDAIPTHFTALLSKLIEYISKDRFGKTQFLKLIESIPNEPCSKIKLHNNEILSRFDGSEKEILAKICSIQTPRELSISRQKKQPL